MEKRITAFFTGSVLIPEYPGRLKTGYRYELIVEDELATGEIEKQGWLGDGDRNRNILGEIAEAMKERYPAPPGAKMQTEKNRVKRKHKNGVDFFGGILYSSN